MTRTNDYLDERMGLRGKNVADMIALRGVRLTGTVSGLNQYITLEQTFVNMSPHAVEAVYTFPLPADAAVCGFEVFTEGRHIKGEIDEQVRAAERYEAAIEQGDAAYALEAERPDVFTAFAGNINPDQAATIKISYVANVECYERLMRIYFPTTIAPRYTSTAGATDIGEAMRQAEAVNPPHTLHVPYGLSMSLKIDPGQPVNLVRSPSHQVAVDQRNGMYVVSLKDGTIDMDRDLVVEVQLQQVSEPTALVEMTEEGERFAALTFIPDLYEDDEMEVPEPCEALFLLDRSGSMGGGSLKEAKKALELCLRSMNPGDYFNICRFDHDYELFSAESVPYDQRSLKRALKWLAATDARGGTELHAPLAALLPMPSLNEMKRDVILLTDGQVSNEDAIIKLAGKYKDRQRLFTFAIGHAASHYLCDGLAKATGGASESIVPGASGPSGVSGASGASGGGGERIDEKVMRTFSRLASPHLSGIKLDWQGAEVNQAQTDIPSLFDGDPLSIHARIEGEWPREVTLSCKCKGEEKAWAIALPAEVMSQKGDLKLAQVWAREKLERLKTLAADSLGATRRMRGASPKKQMIEISRAYQVLCDETTFLAIETRSDAEKNEGDPVQQRVPVQLAAGWHGVVESARATSACFEEGLDCLAQPGGDELALYAPAPASPAYNAPRSRAGRKRVGAGAVAKAKKSGGLLSKLFGGAGGGGSGHAASGGGFDDDFDDSVMGEIEEDLSIQTISDLLSLQTAEGDFEASSKFDHFLQQRGEAEGVETRAWRSILEALIQVNSGSRKAVLNTLLALYALHVFFKEDKAIWRRAHQKAVRWLKQFKDEQVIDVESLFAEMSKRLND